MHLLQSVIVAMSSVTWPTKGGWQPGPMPWPVPPMAGPRPGSATTTDAPARQTMVGERGGRLLYDEHCRSHVQFENAGTLLGLPLVAAELLREEARDATTPALLILHFESDTQDPFVSVRSQVKKCGAVLTLGDSAARREILAYLSLSGASFGHERVRSVVHLTWDNVETIKRSTPKRPKEWGAQRRALYYLASATLDSDAVPDHRNPDANGMPEYLSEDWSCLVLRDGIAFQYPLSDGPHSSFLPTSQMLSRSVYLDAYLLALLQLRGASKFADLVGQAMNGTPTAATALRLEREFLRFRSSMWWTHVGDRETRFNTILRQAQTQHRLPELINQTTEDMAGVARFVEADGRRRRETITWLIAVVSALLLVPSTVFTVGAAWSDPGKDLFFHLLWTAIVLAGLAAAGATIWFVLTGRNDRS